MHFHNSHSISSLTGSDEEGGEDEGGMANQWKKGKDCHTVKYYRMNDNYSVGLCVAMKFITPIIMVMVGWIGNNKETMLYN